MARPVNAGGAVVVGGANVDICGRSYAPLIPADSNPGTVRVSLGGVGRNIAHNMALLGCGGCLLTALGDDFYGQKIAASCRELGIDLSHALVLPGVQTSAYLFLSGPDGDMAMAVNDMAACAHITPAYLRSQRAVLDSARLVVADANLPEESLAWLCGSVRAPIFADPVSTSKAPRLKPVLGRLHTLKPNRLEAELLSGVPIDGGRDLPRAAQALLDTGLRRVFISLGSDGLYAAGEGAALRLPGLPGRIRSATGAGDAFMAALAWAFLNDFGLELSARLAQAAAVIAAEGGETVNPALSAQAVMARAGVGREEEN